MLPVGIGNESKMNSSGSMYLFSGDDIMRYEVLLLSMLIIVTLHEYMLYDDD